jgi:hypothetical protein
METNMDRMTLEEFIADIREDQPVLRDGHELGLIIDETNGESDRLARYLAKIGMLAPSVTVGINDLLQPAEVFNAISRRNNGDTLVLIQTEQPMYPQHYKALQSLVAYHALEEWKDGGNERGMVQFIEQTRFVLVLSREAFEQTIKTYPPIRGILGACLSLDDVREKEGV